MLQPKNAAQKEKERHPKEDLIFRALPHLIIQGKKRQLDGLRGDTLI